MTDTTVSAGAGAVTEIEADFAEFVRKWWPRLAPAVAPVAPASVPLASGGPDISALGLIDIISHEGICLDPYLDSVGVWTIGIGQTKSDGIDPQHSPRLTLQQAIDLFKKKITEYTGAVDDVMKTDGLAFNQFQYDALSSACYNFGPGNLHTLCHHRNLAQIGEALMLYTKPPEITARRRDEQRLYKTGAYANRDGKVLLFPVTAAHRPNYHAGIMIDIRPYFSELQQAAV
jgi:lysozyme